MRESTVHQSQPLWAFILEDLLHCGKPFSGALIGKDVHYDSCTPMREVDPSGCWLGFGERCREDPQCGCMSKRDVSLALPSLTGPCISQEGGEYKKDTVEGVCQKYCWIYTSLPVIISFKDVSLTHAKWGIRTEPNRTILTMDIPNNEDSIRGYIMMRIKDMDFRSPEIYI